MKQTTLLFASMLFFVILTPFSCVSSTFSTKTNKNYGEIDLNQFLLQRIEIIVSRPEETIRIEPTLRFRDHLTMVNSRGLVSNHIGIKMKWQCVLKEHPDTSTVETLPKLPNEFLNKVILNSQIDTLGTDYITTFYYSPVFETKEKGVYAFHESVVFIHNYDGWKNDIILREFFRFRLTEGTIEWLDCCGRTNDPFGL